MEKTDFNLRYLLYGNRISEIPRSAVDHFPTPDHYWVQDVTPDRLVRRYGEDVLAVLRIQVPHRLAELLEADTWRVGYLVQSARAASLLSGLLAIRYTPTTDSDQSTCHNRPSRRCPVAPVRLSQDSLLEGTTCTQ